MAEKEKTSKKMLRYLVKRIIAIAVLAIILTITFVLAMDITNIVILTSDGFKQYATNVLIGEDNEEISKYFTANCLLQMDMPNKRETYKDYVIRDFEHKVSLEWVWILPFGDNATAVITETVANIDGELPIDIGDQVEGKPATPPEWINAKYTIYLTKVYNDLLKTNVWQIDNVVFQNEIISTPEPEASATNTATPSSSTVQPPQSATTLPSASQ